MYGASAYEHTTSVPASSARGPANRHASGMRRSHAPAANPPSAIPPSTTISITANDNVRLCTNIDWKRNQTTSSANRHSPDRKAAAIQRAPAAPSRMRVRGACTGAERASIRRDKSSAPITAHPFTLAAASAAPRTPRCSSSTASVSSTPKTAPAVFQPYRRPRASPKPESRDVNARVRSGSVMPIAVEGTSRAAKAKMKRRLPSRTGWSASGASNGAIVAPMTGNPRTSATPVTATAASSPAYTRTGRPMRSPTRPAPTFPRARPAMNADRTRLDAHTLFPTAMPAWWNHRVSKTRAATPEAKKTAQSALRRSLGSSMAA